MKSSINGVCFLQKTTLPCFHYSTIFTVVSTVEKKKFILFMMMQKLTSDIHKYKINQLVPSKSSVFVTLVHVILF